MPVIGQVIPLNAGDVDSALAYWANDATVRLVGLPAGIRNFYCGKEEVRAWLIELAAQHVQTKIKVIKVQGNAVTTRTEIWNDLYRKLDIAPLEAMEVYLVSENKITQLTSTISPKSLFSFQSALQANHEKGGDFIQEGLT